MRVNTDPLEAEPPCTLTEPPPLPARTKVVTDGLMARTTLEALGTGTATLETSVLERGEVGAVRTVDTLLETGTLTVRDELGTLGRLTTLEGVVAWVAPGAPDGGAVNGDPGRVADCASGD